MIKTHKIISENSDKPYLYILSDDPIVQGDWVYDSLRKTIWQQSKDKVFTGAIYKKIIATSNDSLYNYPNIYAIPSLFISDYAINPVDNVSISYEKVFAHHEDESVTTIYIPKVIDNTIIIVPETPIALNYTYGLYKLEQVEELCRKAYNEGNLHGFTSGVDGLSEEEWIQENLLTYEKNT